MAKQIWVRKGQEVRGPFSVAQIRQLAETGKLTPLHEVSSDQARWKPAGDVPGLAFSPPPLPAAAPGLPEASEGGPYADPISEDELEILQAVTKTTSVEDVLPQLKLKDVDLDELDRLEKSFAEFFGEEARRNVPGVLVSVGLHLVLLFVFWLWRIQLAANEPLVDVDLTIINPADPAAIIRPQDRKIELPAMKLNPLKSGEAGEPGEEQPVQTLNPGTTNAGPGPGPQLVPVQPVGVGGLFGGRTGEGRQQILAKTENGQRIEQAISQGLAWLSRQQQPAGNWRLHTGYPDASEWPDIKTDTGATALALLAFLGNGQTHKSAKDKATEQVVQKGLDWLIRIQNENGNGDFHDLSVEKGRNPAFYAHAQATIVVCEAYAMTKDRTLIGPAQKGVDYLLKSQQPNEGGWKYHPLDAQSVGDLSVTGWVLMALHSARAAGLNVPEEQFQRAAKFLNSVQDKNGALYRYQPTGWDVSRAMTAEGLLCRQFLGWPKNQPQLLEGIEYLLDEKYKPRWSEGRRNVYEWYYVGHVLHNMDDEEWTDWYGHIQEEIITHQITSGSGDYRGSWHPSDPVGAPYEFADKAGRLYITSMCLLILEMPIRHQPVYGE